jgi:small GTP-binding protein
MQNSNQFKVVLIGSSGVGKSSIMFRFASDSFDGDAKATIGVNYLSKVVIVDDNKIKLNIWDTAGQERYAPLARMHCRDADAAILVYDITNRRSFDDLENWVSELTTLSASKGIGEV